MKVAVIGCGYWGPNLVRNFVQSNKVDEVTCCDRDQQRLDHMRKLYPMIKTTQNFKELLDQPDLDGVAVATPVYTHFPIAREFLQHGKHVFIEKPFTHSIETAAELIKLAEEKQRILMVGHTFEYTAAVTKIRELIGNGELGKLLYINCTRVNLGLFQPDINVVWDLAPHDLSIIMYVTKEVPLTVNSQGKAHFHPEIEDVAITTLHFKGGLVAFIHNSWLDPNKIRRTTFVGTKKMLVYDDIETQEKIKIYDKGLTVPPYYDTFADFQFSYRYGDIYIPRLDDFEPLRKQITHFLECIEHGCQPLTDGYSGLRVVSILEAANTSIKNGGKATPVRFPSEMRKHMDLNKEVGLTKQWGGLRGAAVH
ncbi:MAG: Gfo/Idh/MocA family oxidoreductase [Deltaproteobacteria bacterium]|nr:Gfo/Idh/MocA family oxidoreductase [Deltaproteobacteria bacterium]